MQISKWIFFLTTLLLYVAQRVALENRLVHVKDVAKVASPCPQGILREDQSDKHPDRA